MLFRSTEIEAVPGTTNWQVDTEESGAEEGASEEVTRQPTSITPRRTALTPKQARKRKGSSGLMLPHAE